MGHNRGGDRRRARLRRRDRELRRLAAKEQPAKTQAAGKATGKS
jgi:hypothetical protein